MRGEKTFLLLFFVSFMLPVCSGFCENKENVAISQIDYEEKTLPLLSEIPLSRNGEYRDSTITHKVDELIDLLEAHKQTAAQDVDIKILQKKINEITQIIEEQQAGPPEISSADFYNSLCFRCHKTNEFSPADKTLKQWQRLIEADGHAIFAEIPWESPLQKKQILQFLMENAGNYRSQGIGHWD
jgi:hypothetical protein